MNTFLTIILVMNKIIIHIYLTVYLVLKTQKIILDPLQTLGNKNNSLLIVHTTIT